MPGPRLILLRHGEVVSHRGDQPLTEAGREQAERAGHGLASRVTGPVRLLCSATLRASQTADGIRAGLTAADPDLVVGRPTVAFALRNPDLYLAGERVDMVSSAQALADQVPGLSADAVAAVPFFADFLGTPDRIGRWVEEPLPPGDDVAAVAARIVAFGSSLGDSGPAAPATVVAVTHSPVLRAVAVARLGQDPGEPPYLEGYALDVTDARSAAVVQFSPFD